MSVKVNQNIEQGLAEDPKFQRYATRLRAMDKDGNGVLDMDEVCEAIDQMVQQESQNRLLKKVAIVSGILSLLTIAAVVGLTAGVIILSKDIEDNDNVLRSTSSGSAMATAEYLNTNGLEGILSNPDPVALSSIKTLTVGGAPDSGVNFTVHTVTAASIANDGSVVFELANGEKMGYKLDAERGVVSTAENAAAVTEAAQRRLLADSETVTKGSCSYPADCNTGFTGTGITAGCEDFCSCGELKCINGNIITPTNPSWKTWCQYMVAPLYQFYCPKIATTK